jgi:hypothetical protein
MHECALIPEGVSDVAWLEALQTALEQHQDWTADPASQQRFSTFVGVVPTDEAKIADTLAIISRVHSRPCVLLDGDGAGRGYFDAVKVMNPPPCCVVFWPQDWAMEHVLTWIVGADEASMLPALGAALGEAFADAPALTDYLLSRESYAPTHETTAVALMANTACRARAAQMLTALSDVLCDPANATTALFKRIQADSTIAMQVFQFAPP